MTMEKRAILAAVLMAALLMIYQTFFVPVAEPPPAQKPPAEAPATDKTATPAPPAPSQATPLPAARPEAPPRPREPGPRPPQRLAAVDTPLYRSVVSSEGGKLQELTLKYRGEKPMVVVGELGHTGLTITPEGSSVGEVVPMAFASDQLTVGPGRTTGNLVLTGEVDGLKITETLTFHADTFAIDATLRLENTTRTPRTVTLALPWSTRQEWLGAKERFTGQHPTEIVWATNGHVERVEDLTVVGDKGMDGSWIGVGSVWYLAAFVPRSPGFKLVASGDPKPAAKNGDKKDDKPAPRARIAVRATPTIAPGQAWEGRVAIYAGPKEYARLKPYGLEGTINFGGFPIPRQWGGLPMEWFGVPILLLMNWVYDHVGNYGIAIILLTVLSKILFYPLTVKSMRSMKAMQALGPQVNTLRNKYQSDPQRLQRETMELYRKHKVNPMGGCLPMIAQVPIFYALYLALSVSVELQNASFLCFGRVPGWVPLLGGTDLWICDLANYDPTYVLPLLMGVSMFVQQKMTPVAGDPRQAKMMLVMPFVFTFMFLNLPSGLVLYWTVSNVLQILQQWYMDRPKREQAGREVATQRR
jgi:YidC/Oxa1 family membrane protein insertase